jgi:hypothetical protein
LHSEARETVVVWQFLKASPLSRIQILLEAKCDIVQIIVITKAVVIYQVLCCRLQNLTHLDDIWT